MTTTCIKPPIQQETLSYMLIGRPNCGKTSIFNALTGLRQKVANYPGVTVEKKWGVCFAGHGKPVNLLDLPGLQNLHPNSPDETILQDVLYKTLSEKSAWQRIVCVIDTACLERSLYLVLQILELQRPTILVLHTIGPSVPLNLKKLTEHLPIPTIFLSDKKESIIRLKMALVQRIENAQGVVQYSKNIEDALESLQSHCDCSKGEALMYLWDTSLMPEKHFTFLTQIYQNLCSQEPNWKNSIIHERYKKINQITQDCLSFSNTSIANSSEKIDKIALHPIFGWVTFFLSITGIFWTVFEVSNYPMQWIETALKGIEAMICAIIPASQTQNLITQGILPGIGNVVMFLPQILSLFFFIGILELSGYLPRAVFLMDGLMRKVGLQGKSFIPLLSSYGCAIPGIMATRIISSAKERLATILIAPWMSCSARLPIYLLMISILLPSPTTPSWKKALLLSGIYFTGTFMALLTALLLRKTALKGSSPLFILELPKYQFPCLKSIGLDLWSRLVSFMRKAGTFILAFSILFWILTNYPQNKALSPSEHIKQSYAGRLGLCIEPLITPLGYDWKIGVGLLSSFAARELFLGTLGIIYQVEKTHLAVADCGCGCCKNYPAKRSNFASILMNQKKANGDRVYSASTCLSLIIFYIFALQCTSTLVVVRKETGSWKWPLMQFIGMTFFAYLSAFLVYQALQFFNF